MKSDGKSVMVEDVRPGDVLMGDDSEGREVLETHFGVGKLYRITFDGVEGELCDGGSDPGVVVNGAHILCLKFVGSGEAFGGKYCLNYGDIVEISVLDYLSLEECERQLLKWFRVGVNYPFSRVAPDCGMSMKIEEDANYEFGLSLLHSSTSERIGIPDSFKFSSRWNRLKLLAGIKDSIAATTKAAVDPTVPLSISVNFEQLAEDILHVSRSIGIDGCIRKSKNIFFAQIETDGALDHVNNPERYSVILGKNGNEIPSGTVLMDYCQRGQLECGEYSEKSATILNFLKPEMFMLCDFHISEEEESGEYFGFEVDGNHRFLLEDFSVVHNSTVSSSLAVQLAKVRDSVLIISTDPAHNLGDVFCQKVAKTPTLIQGFGNLYGMEIEPHFDTEDMFGSADFGQGSEGNSFLKNLMKDIGSSLPGMDEVSSFMEMIRQVKQFKFSCVVFDTAPTGHTLRLLSIPTMMDSSLGKLFKVQNFGNILGQFGSLISDNLQADKMQENLKNTRDAITQVSQIFRNPSKCTFVCVCIPEFLSVYETERLIQELTKNGIDSRNIVVNQVLFKSSSSNCPNCDMCDARRKIQQKYLNQIFELYKGFHITQLPLLKQEVRGIEALQDFGDRLLSPYSDQPNNKNS